MDNLTHSLLGAALAYTGLNRVLGSAGIGATYGVSTDQQSGSVTLSSPLDPSSSAVTTLMILAANLPDIDIATTPAPLVFLEHHRGYTHTYWGIVLLALLLPLPFLRWNRAIRIHPAPFRKKYFQLFAVSLLGTASHLFLDFTNAYGIRPARPFSQRWIYGDFVPIIDPWIYLILGVALFLITCRGRWRGILWTTGITVISLAILLYGRNSIPDPLWTARIVWFTVLTVTLLVKRIAVRRLAKAPHTLAIACLILLCGYYLLCWQLHRTALNWLRLETAERYCSAFSHREAVALPVPGNPFLWSCFADEVDQYCSGEFRALEGTVFALRRVSKNLDGLPFKKTMETCSGKVMMRFSRFPVLEQQMRPDGWVVFFRDLRFAPLPGRSGFASRPIYFDKQWRERQELSPVCPWSEGF